jgi:hypothetical protein
VLLRRVLVISAIIGSLVPFLSVYLWFALHFGDLWGHMHGYLYQNWQSHSWPVDVLADMLLGAILNVPIYMAIGTILWAIYGRGRGQTKPRGAANILSISG